RRDSASAAQRARRLPEALQEGRMNRNSLWFLIGVQSSPNRRAFSSLRGGTAAGIRGLLTAIEGRACTRSGSEISPDESASRWQRGQRTEKQNLSRSVGRSGFSLRQ